MITIFNKYHKIYVILNTIRRVWHPQQSCPLDPAYNWYRHKASIMENLPGCLSSDKVEKDENVFFSKFVELIVTVLTISRRSIISWTMKSLLVMSFWVLQQTFRTQTQKEHSIFERTIPLLLVWSHMYCCNVYQNHLIDHLKDLQKFPQTFRLVPTDFTKRNVGNQLSRCIAK